MRNRASLLVVCCLLIVATGSVVQWSHPILGSEEAATGTNLTFHEESATRGINYTATRTGSPTGGAGVYVNDFNGDHRPDLLLLGGTDGSWQYTNRKPILFENTGTGFVQSRELPRETLEGHTFESALFFDYDNDGWQELLLLPRHDTPIFLENDRGTLTVEAVGLNATLGVPIGAAAADYTGNGCLDLFIYQNGDWTDRTPAGLSETFHTDGNVSVTDDNGNPNLLYRGNCSGFTNVTGESGIEGTRWTLAASFVDVTGDGRPDIHVGNDYNYDYLYINQGDGTFQQVRLDDATNRNAMASEVVDINGDGRLDIFVTNIYINTSYPSLDERRLNYIENRLGNRIRGNNLLINDGDGRFVDRARNFNVHKGGWGWAASIGDFDNDGRREIFHTTEELEGYYDGTVASSFAIYPVFYERDGDAFVLRDPRTLGLEQTDGRGVGRLDFDRDGRLDLAVAAHPPGDRYRLYRTTGTAGNWVQMRVLGTANQTAIGAEVYLTTGDKTYHRVKTTRNDFLSQDTRVVHFGLGNRTHIESVRVVWPDGTRRTFTNMSINQRYFVTPNGTEPITDAIDR